MNWLCNCWKKPARILYLLWVYKTDLPHSRPRWVAYRCELLCEDCASKEDDPTYHRRADEEFLSVGLTAGTKEALQRQILAQVIGKTRGYVPKTDLQKAASRLRLAN